MKHIEVVAAIIINENKILCVQRNWNKFDYISFKYEFPGGKIELGESQEDALTREIDEELNMAITVKEKFLTVNHDYPDFKLTMHSFICTCENPIVNLTEHISYEWLNKNDLIKLDWATADLPIVEKLTID